MKGKVKNYFADRGFGFIRTDSGEDVFVHARVVKQASLSQLEAGQIVEFEIGMVQGRTRAVSVAVIFDPAKDRRHEAAASVFARPSGLPRRV